MQNQARKAGDSEALTASEQFQQLFLNEHMGAWFGPFAATSKSGAETEFYRLLAGPKERLVCSLSGSALVH